MSLQQETCLICKLKAETHHIKTRGSGGTDDYWNLSKLCRGHHYEIHQIGMTTFCNKYRIFLDYISLLGWYQLSNGKWFNDKIKEQE